MSRVLVCFLLLSSALIADVSEFQKLMGRKTSHWTHVSKQEDVVALEKFETLYETNKELRFSKGGAYKIPKVIHFIWLGPNPFPPKSVQNVRTWIAHHPDWTVKFWTDRDRPPPCSSMVVCDVDTFPFLLLRHCYDKSQNWGEKSDVLRFELLYQEGGVYVDHDANCLQSFDGLHMGYNFYCGLEAPHPPFAGRNITSGNGVIGSSPAHPVVERVLELIGEKWEHLGLKYQGRDGYSRTQLVMERTYMKLTDALSERLEQDGNVDIVFPAAYFFAKKGISPLYSEHFFANSWAEEGVGRDLNFERRTKKAFQKMRQRNKMICWIARGALSFNLLAFSGISFYLIRRRRRRQG